MRLRAQLLLSALGTAVVCGVLGVWLLGQSAERQAESLLDDELRIGEQAMVQRWALRRAERKHAFEAVAQQAALRTELESGVPAALDRYTQRLRKAGADLVLVIDRGGQVRARAGDGAELLATRLGELGEDTTLLRSGRSLLEAVVLPIGSAPVAGQLVLGSRVDEATLRRDAEPLGLAAAVSLGGLTVSTLAPHDDEAELVPTEPHDRAGSSPPLRRSYRLRTVPLGPDGAPGSGVLPGRGDGREGARLVLAIPLTHVRAFTTAFIGQIAGLLALILAATVGVALIIVERMTAPIERLQRAADLLGQGQLQRSRRQLRRFATRQDEIGALARAFTTASLHLTTVVNTCQKLATHLDAAAGTTDRSAAALLAGAARQGDRLDEVNAALAPLVSALEQTSQGLSDAHSLALTVSLASSAADQSMAILAAAARRAEALVTSESSGNERSFRTASLLQQVAQVVAQSGVQREHVAKVREQVNALKRRVDESLESQAREQHQGQLVQGAIADIGRLSKQQAREAESLRSAAEELRRDVASLREVLASLETESTEDTSPSQTTGAHEEQAVPEPLPPILESAKSRVTPSPRNRSIPPVPRASQTSAARSHTNLRPVNPLNERSAPTRIGVPSVPPRERRRSSSELPLLRDTPAARSGSAFAALRDVRDGRDGRAGHSAGSLTPVRDASSARSAGALLPIRDPGRSAGSLTPVRDLASARSEGALRHARDPARSAGSLTPVRDPNRSAGSLTPVRETASARSDGSIRPVREPIPARSGSALLPVRGHASAGPTGRYGERNAASSATWRPIKPPG